MSELPALSEGKLMTSGDDPMEWWEPAAGGVSPAFRSWLAERSTMTSCEVERIRLDELRGWAFDETTGNLAHESGRFFVVEGVHVRTTYGAVAEWYQPIINQPEIGILGMLMKLVDGVPHCLLQAKVEPGNINMMQLSPTVQATRSNYTRVHGGGGTRYLEYFTRPGAGRVLVDVLQSEQGSWFLHKRNRNMVVLVDDVPPSDYHYWLPLHEVRRLLRIDVLVNMDTRSVLSCLPSTFFAGSGVVPANSAMAAALARSASGEGPSHRSTEAVLSWFTEAKSRHELAVSRISLRDLRGWRHTPYEISREDGRHFSIVGVTVRINNREVTEWSQPLLHPRQRGIIAFALRIINGVAHVLVHARFQVGLLDAMEMGPTVQCTPSSDAEQRPPFLDLILNAPSERILFDTVLAEEGGRFYRAENRYMLVEVGDDLPAVPDTFCWVAVHQLATLLRHGYYLNVEARSLLACLHSLW
ncbi:NDP-hexose 2,3-dehydratase family protein [Micromonospora carbonacea]|uniref:NDP-hexose 2,3-dehydratase family protein n=1 Tax=Micromonospora carbonacea TaxID=47853 RepID=A0A7H8XWE0_9ACTN|nr:NDP-hexose 2,3-dehydratase family protein [Micromonospora carbonacea]MBB5828979.1 oxidase EvaA [Micromonospora carbonacea]QLD28332.2 NDP-hexose 2,3-dehydratase family protein [Micromonospora carbonacea]